MRVSFAVFVSFKLVGSCESLQMNAQCSRLIIATHEGSLFIFGEPSHTFQLLSNMTVEGELIYYAPFVQISPYFTKRTYDPPEKDMSQH